MTNLDIILPTAFRDRGAQIVSGVLVAAGVNDPTARLLVDGVRRTKQALLAQAERGAYEVAVGTLTMSQTFVRQYDHVVVKISDSGPAATGDQYMSAILSAVPVVCAREFDPEFDRWQNMLRPQAYTESGRVFPSLVPNGMPGHLHRMVADISQNPGRRVLRHGYVEMIGPVMWLGEAFWDVVPRAQRGAVASAEWLTATQGNGFLHVRDPAGPYSESDLARPMRMRRLLFPEGLRPLE